MAVKDPIVIDEAFDWGRAKSPSQSSATSEASCRRLSDPNDGSTNGPGKPRIRVYPARSPGMVDGDQEPHIGTRTATSITDSEPLMRDPFQPPRVPLHLQSFDGALGRNIIDLHVWAVRQGLIGIDADAIEVALRGREGGEAPVSGDEVIGRVADSSAVDPHARPDAPRREGLGIDGEPIRPR